MKFSFETTSNLTPEKIWPFYQEIDKWFIWEKDLEEITLDGPFQEGTSGTMKLVGQPAMNYTLVSVTPNKEFSDKTFIPNVGTIYFSHELILENQKTVVKHSVMFIPENRAANVADLTFISQVFADVPTSIFALIEAAQ